MATDPGLLAALERAIEREPNEPSLRIQVAELQAVDRNWDAVLLHVEAVLAQRPASGPALSLAAQACEALGQVERADGYRRLLAALAGAPSEEGGQPAALPGGGASTAQPVAVSGGTASGAALDAFLDEVLDPDVASQRPTITLADVGGLAAVKDRLQRSFLGPMGNPELRRMYGKSLRGGLLLYGPPGCGKTFLAKAVAGELGARFFALGLHEVLDMWLGQSEQNLHGIFETARRQAPCVIFLDEVDAMGMKRSNLTRSAGRNVVVQLLSELDGVDSDNDGVFVLAASNQPWDIDPALRRPGRLDRMLLVLPPDAAAREAILRVHLRDRPIDSSVDLRPVVAATEGYSGADLALLCDAAAEAALDDSIRTGRARPISQEDLITAGRETQQTTRPWFDMARNYAMFANEGGLYDDLLAYMRAHGLS